MKVRTEFVTNSSTTSFCIVGTQFGSPDNPNGADLYELADKAGLEFYSNDGYEYYVGLGITRMPDNVTMKQYKEKAQKSVDKFIEECKKVGIKLPKDLSIEIIEETIAS
jgi:hypothetical protein